MTDESRLGVIGDCAVAGVSAAVLAGLLVEGEQERTMLGASVREEDLLPAGERCNGGGGGGGALAVICVVGERED